MGSGGVLRRRRSSARTSTPASSSTGDGGPSNAIGTDTTPRRRASGRASGHPTQTTSAVTKEHHLSAAASLDEAVGVLDAFIATIADTPHAASTSDLPLGANPPALSTSAAQIVEKAQRDWKSADTLQALIGVIDERHKPTLEFVLGALGASEVPEQMAERQRHQGAKAYAAFVRNRTITKKRESLEAAASTAAETKSPKTHMAAKAEKIHAARDDSTVQPVSPALGGLASVQHKEMGEKAVMRANIKLRDLSAPQTQDLIAATAAAMDAEDAEQGTFASDASLAPEREASTAVTQHSTFDGIPGAGEAAAVDACGDDRAAPVRVAAKGALEAADLRTSPTAAVSVISSGREKPVLRARKDLKTKFGDAADLTGGTESLPPTNATEVKSNREPPGVKDGESRQAEESSKKAVSHGGDVDMVDVLPTENAKGTQKTAIDDHGAVNLGLEKGRTETEPNTQSGKGASPTSKKSQPAEGQREVGERGRATTSGVSLPSKKERKVSSDQERSLDKGAKIPLEHSVGESTCDAGEVAKDDELTPSRTKGSLGAKASGGIGGKGSKASAGVSKMGAGTVRNAGSSRGTAASKSASGLRSGVGSKSSPAISKATEGGGGVRRTRLRRESSNLRDEGGLMSASRGALMDGASPYMAQCYDVWKSINSERITIPFRLPVTVRDAPEYFEVVKRPMDLSTVRANLENGKLSTPAEFLRDMLLICRNAMQFNDKDSDLYELAYDMRELIKAEVSPVVQRWRSHVGAGPGGLEAWSSGGEAEDGDEGPLKRYPSRRSGMRAAAEGPAGGSPREGKRRLRGRGGGSGAGTSKRASLESGPEEMEESEEEGKSAPRRARRRGGAGKGGKGGKEGKGANEGKGGKEAGGGGGGRKSKRASRSQAADDSPDEVVTKRRRLPGRRNR